MKKIILPNQTYFVTTNTRQRRWVFAYRRETGFPPTRGENGSLLSRRKIDDDTTQPRSRRSRSPAKQGLVLPSEQTCQILLDNLVFYREKFSFLLHGFIFMPDHVHLLLTVGNKGSISEIMRDWKHRTVYELNRVLDKQRDFWQFDFWEHAIRNDLDFTEKLNYIHQNPVRAGFVQKAEEWEYSSVRWYTEMESCIVIDAL